MKISLIMTIFNGAKYLRKAIDSFLAQDYENKELIILDGKSTDDSHEIIAEYQKKFPQIKWIKENDRGISHARNIALKHAKGDLIGFLGADDILHKNFYQEMSYYFKINPDFDVIYANGYSIGGKNSSLDNSAAIAITRRNLIRHCPIASGECFYYRREIFSNIQFNEKNFYSMDYELNMALVLQGSYRFFPINISAVFNGNYGDSISSSNGVKQRLETILVQLKYAKNLWQKMLILFCRKKFILENLPQFLMLKNEYNSR